MLEDHGYITYASITTFENEFLTIWLSWKQKYSKLLQVCCWKNG